MILEFVFLVEMKKLVISQAQGKIFFSDLRFPVHPFMIELLHLLNIASRQLMPNLWKTVISCMEIWLIVNDRDMIRLDEFVHLYCLKESKLFGYYELVNWERKVRLVFDFPSSF